jgi:hypothetical protein
MNNNTRETKTGDKQMTPMTSRDRAELGKLLRMRAKVTKSGIDQQQAALIADVEQQLSASYKFDDEIWQDVTRIAQAEIAKADAEIAKRCKALGIAAKLRPSISISWSSRGENYLAARRAELRMTARTRIEELAQEAKVTVDRDVADKMTILVAGGLDSEEGRKFLESMPTVDSLMPRIKIERLSLAPNPHTRYQYRLDRWEPGQPQREIEE